MVFELPARALRRIAYRLARFVVAGVVLLAFAGCNNAAPALAPTAQPLLLPGELNSAGRVAGREVGVVGYLLADTAGAVLVDSVMFEADGQPRPLSPGGAAIWLGEAAPEVTGGALHTAGGRRYAAVIVRGALEGPAAFGPGGAYPYQLAAPRVELLGVQETSIAALLDGPAAQEDQAVRVVGGLLVRDGEALLVERLGAGGLPEPKTRQLKLRAPLHDPALLARLGGAAEGKVRFGQVQIEGLWRAGTLAPLSITVLT